MKYLGGKSKLAKPIVETITSRVGGARVWEPFCGGGAVTCELAKSRPYVASTDVSKPLISMWRALQDGWRPPETLSEQEYHAAKALADVDPLKAFAGFACSFGGKWFAGYARGGSRADGTPRDHSNEAYRNVCASIGHITNVGFARASFFDIDPRSGMVLYCDPPYADTEAYKGTAEFPHAEFWTRVRHWVDCGSRVFVSEFSCPVRHRVLRVFERTIGVTQNKQKRATDTLFEIIK